MRNISYALTTQQVQDGTKDVTRRLGWKDLKPGALLMACEKCQGIAKGELNRLRVIRVISVRREKLRLMLDDWEYGLAECVREGFPRLRPSEFVVMFCEHQPGRVNAETVITRIEFRYIPGGRA